MPKTRPPTSGYARIAQDEEQRAFLDGSDDEDAYNPPTSISTPGARYAPIQPRPAPSMQASHLLSPAEQRRPGRRRGRSNSSGVDIKAINARLERWADEIASKFKRGKGKDKTVDDVPLEIHHSVFQAPEGVRPATRESLLSLSEGGNGRVTKIEFDDVVESVRVAIEMGMHPTMISQGSSGSYFARNTEGTIVGVFKPKDEEPYASRNPKWTKWIHRNLFPCFFGRACLIPNLSYVSEAAAYVLDSRLQTNLVPYTDIVYLSSKSFFYDFWDRRKFYRNHKPFPQKVGSFQVFLKGFKDANIFLRDHPWPDQHNSSFQTEAAPKRRRRPWNESCRPSGVTSDDEDEDGAEERQATAEAEVSQRRFFWTDALQISFREELEKLVILDYIMRNTDRGLDNWMIKIDWQKQDVTIVSEPPRMNGSSGKDVTTRSTAGDPDEAGLSTMFDPYRRQEPMAAISRSQSPYNGDKQPSISLGAIDNSLSWPWKHPDAWRSFPFGWLFLPVSLIGQPFSQKTRDHFLPLLTSTAWWSETQLALRRVFSQDSDFKERMFAKQIAVMKGQAWNVVETLKTQDHGPLELTRRARVCVWDDLVDVPVAVPMRVTSAEVRRKNVDMHASIDEEEMDISAAHASAPRPQHDLLGLNQPPADLPSANRFDLSRSESNVDITSSPEDVRSLASPTSPVAAEQIDFGSNMKAQQSGPSTRPGPRRTRSRLSYEGPARGSRAPGHKRRFSLSTRLGSTGMFYDDDLEGDLGYAAAEGMEKNQRKVIIERLETVKSKHPVFTWC